MPASAMVLYGAVSRPEDDISPSGGAIDTTHRPLWYELSWPSVIQVISTSATDFRTVTITGRDATGNAASEIIRVRAKRAATGTIEFIHIDKVEASATDPTATLYIVQLFGDLMLHDINPGELGGFRMFLNSNASTVDPLSRYEKLFWKNTDDDDVPTLATVELSHDAIGKISIGLDTVVNGTQSVANRFVAPGGVTFVDDDVPIAVPGGTLAAGSAIGVWIKQTLSVNDGPYDAFLGLLFCGDFPENNLLGCPAIQPPVCLFNCGPPCCPPPPPPPPPGGTVAFIECGHTCPLGQEAFATITTATAAGGPAIRVTPTSTDLSFTGLVAVVVPAQNVIAMVLFTAQPIATFDLSQVIDSASYTYVNGDVVRIFADTTTPTDYSVTVNGSTVLTASVADATLETSNPCIGFVPVEGSPTITVEAEEGEPDVLIIATADVQRNTTVTATADPVLVVPMLANEKWYIEWTIFWTADGTTPDVKWGVFAPALATGETSDEVWNTEVNDLNVVGSGMSLDTAKVMSTIRAMIINGANAGNAELHWAQLVSNAQNTTRLKHSSVIAFKQS